MRQLSGCYAIHTQSPFGGDDQRANRAFRTQVFRRAALAKFAQPAQTWHLASSGARAAVAGANGVTCGRAGQAARLRGIMNGQPGRIGRMKPRMPTMKQSSPSGRRRNASARMIGASVVSMVLHYQQAHAGTRAIVPAVGYTYNQDATQTRNVAIRPTQRAEATLIPCKTR